MLFRPITPARQWRSRLLGLLSPVRLLLARLGRWWALDEEVRRLVRLDDRLLADMGIQRKQIRARIRRGHLR